MSLGASQLWLCFLLLLPLLLFVKKKVDVKRKNKQPPPGPPKLPIIGNLHQLGSLPHQSLWQLSKKYGPVMFLQLGGVPTVIVSSSKAAEEVLKVHDLDCCSRPKLAGTGKLSYNYLDIAFSPYGDYWREMRKLGVLELFSTKRVQSFREELLTLAANITCKVALGKSFRGSGFDGDRFQEIIHEAMAMLGCLSASDFFPSVGWMVDRLTGLHARLERSFKELDAFYQQVIDDHLNPARMKPDQDDIIDVLLKIEKDQAEIGAVQVTKDHIKAILMNIFLAGVDTGTITMVWAMAELAKNPRVMKKVQGEIRSCVGKKGIVSETDIDQLQFLKMVVKETLRLHPPGTLLIPRETISHFKLNGYDIDPKTRLQVNVWAIGRDPSNWKDPEEFLPERFTDSSVDFKGQHFELLPFGAGRRGCPGIYMGTAMVELTLANLLYSFDWKLPSGMKEQDIDMEEAAGQTVYKKSALSLASMSLCASHLWLCFLLLLPLLLFMKKKVDEKRKNRQPPPGPPKLPIIGNLHQLGSLLHRSLWQLSKKYGPVMFLQLGGVPTVIVSSSKAAEEVLKVHDLDCCSRPKLAGAGKLSYNYLDMAFSPYGDYWREMRKIGVVELFSTKMVQSFRYAREEEVAFLIESMAQSSSAGRAVNLSEELLTLTANITCRVALGKSFRGSGFDGDRFQEIIHEAMAMLGCLSASDFFPSVGWIVDRLTGLHARLERSFKELDAFYQQVIDDHLNPARMKPDQDDIIDVLLKIEKDQSGIGAVQFTRDHIKAIIMDIFLAGVDTGTITMVWAMAELAKNPRVMKKVQGEIRSCVGKKGRVSETEVDQLQFLKMVVKETLRLHPPATLLVPRETMSYFKLNGYDIDPKTRLQVNVWAIGRDPNNWKDPEEFLPERFTDSSVDFKGQHFELLPFGAGRRVCPGIYMATTMVELTLANLLLSFDWKLPHGMKEQDIDMEEAAGQTVYKKSPLCLVPIVHQ
ncbi:hypothetical protein RJ639_042524 [Escallonia herrerae]|uniref:Cytochrome P450 n=1 Tax=Escallonia herrerae TaxID=1293975 RepID=A0AA88WFA6_9ASTE|nr:hypothetical protein RJ639_042524 [Escallonia herrerae]